MANSLKFSNVFSILRHHFDNDVSPAAMEKVLNHSREITEYGVDYVVPAAIGELNNSEEIDKVYTQLEERFQTRPMLTMKMKT